VAQIIPENHAAIAWEFSSSQGTQPFITTLACATSSLTIPQALADDMFDLWVEFILPNQYGDLFLERVIVTVPLEGGGTATVSSTQTSEQGLVDGDSCSFSMALLVDKKTATLGRAGRGRMFIPGLISQTDVTAGGLIGAGSIVVYDAMLLAFLTSMVEGNEEDRPGYLPVLLHSDESLTPSSVISLVSQQKVGTMRKRIR